MPVLIRWLNSEQPAKAITMTNDMNTDIHVRGCNPPVLLPTNPSATITIPVTRQMPPTHAADACNVYSMPRCPPWMPYVITHHMHSAYAINARPDITNTSSGPAGLRRPLLGDVGVCATGTAGAVNVGGTLAVAKAAGPLACCW